MPIWIDPAAKVPYVLEDERDLPKDEQTTFYLRPLKASEFVAFSMHVTRKDDGALQNIFEYHTNLLSMALVGWEGGGAPEFAAQDGGGASDDSLSRIPSDDRWELARAADKLNFVDKTDTGK